MSFSVTSRRRGSSPLTRGKHVTDVTRARRCGLIPAHAGKTRGWSVVPQASGAHPRSRGENSSRVNGKPALQGSSPLTRGKQTPWGEWAYALRLIPAHAGKTRAGGPHDGGLGAHPRSRGENCSTNCPSTQTSGSSPLTRGKPWTTATRRFPARLIPAHAGKTRHVARAVQKVRAHPRSRGENNRSPCGWIRASGSSPLTRGKPHTPRPSSRASRLIPAHAGKTPSPHRLPDS